MTDQEKGPELNTGDIVLAFAVARAMKQTEDEFCTWWENPRIEAVIKQGIYRGWVLRLSTTQVQYTDRAEEEMFQHLR